MYLVLASAVISTYVTAMSINIVLGIIISFTIIRLNFLEENFTNNKNPIMAGKRLMTL